MLHRLHRYVILGELSLLVIVFFLQVANSEICIAVLVGMLSLSLLFLIFGVFAIRLNYFLRASHFTSDGSVLLTFDDGPDAKHTPQILDVLKRHNVKAVFFVIGRKAEAHPDLLKRIVEEGHGLGNHTYSHSVTFPFYPLRELDLEISRTTEVLCKHVTVGGNLFRPPFGITNPNIALAVNQRKMNVVGWSFRSFDTVIVNSHVLRLWLNFGTRHGRIILLHDTLPQTVDTLEHYITDQLKSGVVFSNSKSIDDVYDL